MDLSSIIAFLKIISFFFSIFFVGIIIVYSLNIITLKKKKLLQRHNHFNNSPPTINNPRNQQWQNIAEQFRSNDPNLWRLAIIDADAMLDNMILSMGYQGDNFGERLKNMQRQGVSWTDAAWDVHLLRNKVAHEGSRFPLNDRDVYRAYKIYENLLENNGYLA